MIERGRSTLSVSGFLHKISFFYFFLLFLDLTSQANHLKYAVAMPTNTGKNVDLAKLLSVRRRRPDESWVSTSHPQVQSNSHPLHFTFILVHLEVLLEILEKKDIKTKLCRGELTLSRLK